ncbi:hypothetical protein QUF72_11995 [Desulfobacterales bacterium HSG2]|nr:hypothetical protein [Desulfobacterales bacterium HSG2]
MLLALKDRNDALKSFKGIGKIKLRDKNIFHAVRVAWLGTRTGKLRIEVLDVSGRPAASIASDGKWFYFLSHAEQRFYKKRAADPSLKKIVLIPVKSSDIITLLGGRIPIRDHNSVSIIKDTFGHTLVLKAGFGNIREKIYLDQSKTTVYKIEMFDIFGSLTYRAEFGKVQDVKDYRIPFRMKLSDDKDKSFQLRIDRYWADVPVSPPKFVLTPIE